MYHPSSQRILALHGGFQTCQVNFAILTRSIGESRHLHRV